MMMMINRRFLNKFHRKAIKETIFFYILRKMDKIDNSLIWDFVYEEKEDFLDDYVRDLSYEDDRY